MKQQEIYTSVSAAGSLHRAPKTLVGRAAKSTFVLTFSLWLWFLTQGSYELCNLLIGMSFVLQRSLGGLLDGEQTPEKPSQDWKLGIFSNPCPHSPERGREWS